MITRHSVGRLVTVTIGLALAGALFGGIAGAVVLMTGALLSKGADAVSDPTIVLLGALPGIVLGAAFAPLAGWLLLRRVPLGRAFGGLTVGTVTGGVVGWFLPLADNRITSSIVAGALGFLFAALLLRARHGSTSRDPLDGAA